MSPFPVINHSFCLSQLPFSTPSSSLLSLPFMPPFPVINQPFRVSQFPFLLPPHFSHPSLINLPCFLYQIFFHFSLPSLPFPVLPESMKAFTSWPFTLQLIYSMWTRPKLSGLCSIAVSMLLLMFCQGERGCEREM